MLFSRSFTTHMEIGGKSLLVDVLYSTKGEYHPATACTPEDVSEIDIFAVYYKDSTESILGLDDFQMSLLYYEAYLDWDVYQYEMSQPDIDRQYDQLFENYI